MNVQMAQSILLVYRVNQAFVSPVLLNKPFVLEVQELAPNLGIGEKVTQAQFLSNASIKQLV